MGGADRIKSAENSLTILKRLTKENDMSITKKDVQEFFAKLEAEAIADAEKAIAIAGQFLRSTYAALAKDPVMTAAIQAGMAEAITEVSRAVATHGTSVLADAALAAGRSLVISVGGTAEHELIPIVAGEIQAAIAPKVIATPTHVNP